MDEFKILFELIKTQGLAGVLAAILVWDRVIYPKWKKSKGHFVSYKEINEELLNHGMRLSELEHKRENNLEKESEKDIKMAKIETEQNHFKEDILEIKNNQRATFKMISEIKNMMIADQK